MELIDVAARLIIPPAELPIGIITAVIGAPCLPVDPVTGNAGRGPCPFDPDARRRLSRRARDDSERHQRRRSQPSAST